jgi:hypothetical protein
MEFVPGEAFDSGDFLALTPRTGNMQERTASLLMMTVQAPQRLMP